MPTQDRTRPDWRQLALLWVARRSGALEALATTAGTSESLAEETGIDPEDAVRLVSALESAGFLTRVDGEVEPTNRLLGFLTKTDLRSIGRLPAELDAFERWVALPDTLTGGSPPEPSNEHRNRLGSEAAIGEQRLRSEVTTAVHAAPDGESVVVVGDGPGRRAVEFAERGWDVTLCDTEARIEAVEPLLRRESVALRPGTPADIPECDLAVFVEVLQQCDTERARKIVAAASAGAPVAVFFDTFSGVTDGAELVDIDLLASGRGAIHDGDTVQAWLADAFGEATIESVPASPLSAAVGRAID